MGHGPVEGISGQGFHDGRQAVENPPGKGQKDYFDELLERIRDIRSSERGFYRKVLEIYATSVDYDPSAEASQLFFATVQNKMHWATHGQTDRLARVLCQVFVRLQPIIFRSTPSQH